MATDPTTTLDRLLHTLGCIQAAHGCLLGSTVANAGIMADYLADSAVMTKLVMSDVEAIEERIKKLEYWLQWVLDNCDDSPEWNFGTDATASIRELLARDAAVTIKGIIKEMSE